MWHHTTYSKRNLGCQGVVEDRLSGTDTYIAHEDLLGGSEVPLDLTVHGVQDDDAIVREDIEHVPHAEAWEEKDSHGYAPPSPVASS